MAFVTDRTYKFWQLKNYFLGGMNMNRSFGNFEDVRNVLSRLNTDDVEKIRVVIHSEAGFEWTDHIEMAGDGGSIFIDVSVPIDDWAKKINEQMDKINWESSMQRLKGADTEMRHIITSLCITIPDRHSGNYLVEWTMKDGFRSVEHESETGLEYWMASGEPVGIFSLEDARRLEYTR